MMRTRESITEELIELNNKHDRDLRVELVLSEVLLDIREHLNKLVFNQGVQKWGTKIGPSAIDLKPMPLEPPK